jgi:hypothetical protein
VPDGRIRAVACFDVLTVPPDTINSNHHTPGASPCSPSRPDAYPQMLIFNAG